MSLEQAIQDARRAINRDLLPARLGNGTGTVYDLQNQGNYYLRKLEANGGLSQPFSLPLNPLANIPPVDGMPVDIGYDPRGVQCIWQCNTASMLSANVNPLILNPIDTAVYGKTSQTNIATLLYQRHGDVNNFPFTVVVFKAPVIINGIAKMFAGAGITVSSFVPSAGLHCYVSVFLRTDMTLEAFASTPKNLLDPLTVDTDIAECITQASANSIVICAYELRGGDTALSSDPARNVDMRQIVNTGSSSSSGSLTITDGSTTVTDVTDLTFNGADFTVTDLGGGAAQVDLVAGSAQIFPTHVTLWHDESKTITGNALTNDIASSISTQAYQTQTYQSPAANGDVFEMQPFLIAAGTYTLSVLGILYNNGGIMKWTLDGVNVITGQDWYGVGSTFNTIKTGSITIATDGIHTLRGVTTGQNVSSIGFFIALTKVWLDG